jgi:hypothetical protein
MELIKKKFISNDSSPVIGEGIIFRIFVSFHTPISCKLPFFIRSGEVITVDWGEGTIEEYTNSVSNISKFLKFNTDTYLDVTIKTNMNDIAVSRLNVGLSDVYEVVNWGDKPIVSVQDSGFGLFEQEEKLVTISEDTNNVLFTANTDARFMFSGCTNLVSVPKLDTSSCVYMNDMFVNATNLQAVYGLDLSSVTDLQQITGTLFRGYFPKLNKIYLTNLGKSPVTYFEFKDCTNWDLESMLYTAEHSFDLKANNADIKTIQLYMMAGNEDAVDIWKNKGYTVKGYMG